MICNAHNCSSSLRTLVLRELCLTWAVLMISQRAKQLLSTDWLYITLLNFLKLSTLFNENGSHKRYATLTSLAVVWAFWSFKIFIWFELYRWALKERNSCCLQITLLNLIINWSTLLIEKGNYNRCATVTTLAVVWGFLPFKMFIWSGLYWWTLKERKSLCLQNNHTLRFLILLSWEHSWSRRVAPSDMQRSQL